MTIQVSAAAGLLDIPTLQKLLQDLAGQFRYMMLASSEDRLFERFNLTQAQDLGVWPIGQVFGLTSELRWRPKRGQFAVCFVTEGATLPPELSERLSEEAVESDDSFLVRLWGEHTEDDVDAAGRPFWVEAQIPRLLAYPLAGAPPAAVALRVQRYLRADGTVAFIRLVDLEGWSHG
jgi:hypothetical protein